MAGEPFQLGATKTGTGSAGMGLGGGAQALGSGLGALANLAYQYAANRALQGGAETIAMAPQGGYYTGGATQTGPVTNIDSTQTYAPVVNTTYKNETRVPVSLPGLPSPTLPGLQPMGNQGMDAPNIAAPRIASYGQATPVIQPAQPVPPQDIRVAQRSPVAMPGVAQQGDSAVMAAFDRAIASGATRPSPVSAMMGMDDTNNPTPQVAPPYQPAPGQPLSPRMAPMAPQAPPQVANRGSLANQAMQEYWNNPAAQRRDFMQHRPQPPSYPYRPQQRGFWNAVAAGAVAGPRAQAMYMARQKAMADALNTQYEQANQNYREELKAHTELTKAGMNQKTQGAITMEQALNQAAKIEAMSPGPNKNAALIRLQGMMMASGLQADFSDIVTRGQSPEDAADTQKKLADASKSVADAMKSVETAASDIESTNAKNKMAIQQVQDYNVTRPHDVQAKIAQDREAISKATVQELSAESQVTSANEKAKREPLETAKLGGQVVRTNQEIAKVPMDQANAMLSRAIGYRQAMAMATPEEKLQLGQMAARLEQQARSMMTGQVGKNTMATTANVMQAGTVPPPPPIPTLAAPTVPPAPAGQPAPGLVAPPAVANAGMVPPPPPGGLQGAAAPQPVAMPMPPQKGAPLVNPQIVNTFTSMALQQAGPGASKDEIADRARKLAQSAGWTVPQVSKAQAKKALKLGDPRLTSYGMPTLGLLGQ